MQLIPVLDILNGVVVRGVAGQRDLYRPIESSLTTSINGLDIARAIRSCHGLNEFYVADLDAITREQPNYDLYRELVADGFRLWIDAGASNVPQARKLLELGASRVIVGLESCPSPEMLSEIVVGVPQGRIIFSLDLKGGVPLASLAWGTDADMIAASAIQGGVTQLIILDLAGVGTGAGVSTISLCQRLREAHGPEIRLITGGGVRGADDLAALAEAGLDGVLLASILHQPGFQIPVSGKESLRSARRLSFRD